MGIPLEFVQLNYIQWAFVMAMIAPVSSYILITLAQTAGVVKPEKMTFAAKTFRVSALAYGLTLMGVAGLTLMASSS